MILVAVASVHSARPLQPEPSTPPKKNPWGSYWGIRSCLGLSSGKGAHLGLAWKLRLLLGMTRSQPSQGGQHLQKHVSMGHRTTLLAVICGLESAAAGGLGWASDGGVNERTVDGGVDFLVDGGLEGAAASGFGIPADGGLEGAVDGGRLAWIAAYSLLSSGLLSRCTQQGGTRNTKTRSKLKITVFNINKAEQDKADTDTDRNTGSNE